MCSQLNRLLAEKEGLEARGDKAKLEEEHLSKDMLLKGRYLVPGYCCLSAPRPTSVLNRIVPT